MSPRTFLWMTGIAFASVSALAQKRVLVRTPLEYGIVENGQRTGIWRYYDSPGILGMEIDYSTFELLYFNPDTSDFVVQTRDGWSSEKLLRPCRFHRAYSTLVEHFRNSVHSPYGLGLRAEQKEQILQSILTFDVGPEGTAGNPHVSGYTKYGMEKMLMKAYESAPNQWIPGIKMDGTPATCRFGISITACPNPDTCKATTPETFKPIYRIFDPSKPPESSTIWDTERMGLQFSPDNKWVLIDAKMLAKTGGDGFLLVPATENPMNQFTRYVLYGDIRNGYWLDDDRIAFKYKYGLAPTVQGMYYLKDDSIITQLDSITYFDRISPDQTRLCVAEYKEKTSHLLTIDPASGRRIPMSVNPFLKPIPLLWSPDQKSIIFSGMQNNFDVLYQYVFENDTYSQLPVMNVQPCGWSKDGKYLYAYRTNFPFSNYSGELFEFNMVTRGFQKLTKKVEGLLFAEFSGEAHQFLVVRNSAMFLVDPSDMIWIKVIGNVNSATWSRDGEHIAFVSEKGSMLNLYNVKTGRTILLHNQN